MKCGSAEAMRLTPVLPLFCASGLSRRHDMKALIISADNFEDSELLVPYYRLLEAGIPWILPPRRKGRSPANTGIR